MAHEIEPATSLLEQCRVLTTGTEVPAIKWRRVLILHPRLPAIVHDLPEVDIDQAGVFQDGLPSCLTIKSVTDYLCHRIFARRVYALATIGSIHTYAQLLS